MAKIFVALLLIATSLPAARTASAQRFQPKSIQFKGATEFSDTELMTAAGLKPGVVLSSEEMNQRSQRLMDTGPFEGLTYKFDGQDLVFQITPAARLFPIRFENIPFGSVADLEAKVHQRVPLYHGKVPGEGGILADICAALQDELKARGMESTVTATPFSDPESHKITAVGFSITLPTVVIGDIQPDGTLDPAARAVLAKAAGMPYDRDGSPRSIEKYVSDAYHEIGYLDAEAHATQWETPVIAPEAIRVPFHLAATAGPLYKIASIQLAPTMVVSQADFDKLSMTRPGDVADGEHVRQNWEFIARQYHNRGFMKARVTATPTLDHAQAQVRYAVDAEAGPVYTMGNFAVENVSDDLRSAILAAWKMPAGAVFNEGAVRGFFATHDANPKLERVFAAVNIKYSLRPHDETRTVDVILRLEQRP
jgi:outer membrane protein insertion porin family